MDTIEITLVRHGETADNINKIIQGIRDTALNENGLLQARFAAEELQDEHFDFIYSSDLKRAYVTAETIAKPHDMKPIPAQGLREWDLGCFEGKSVDELNAYKDALINSIAYGSGDLKIPGGESEKQFSQRIQSALMEIVNRHPGKKVLIVTHAGALRVIFRFVCGLQGKTNLNPQVSNVSISRLKYDGEHWTLVFWNNTSHLKQCKFQNYVLA